MGSRWLLVRVGLVWRLLAAEADHGEGRGCWYMVREASDKAGRGKAQWEGAWARMQRGELSSD
jgi:hypothetical protein